MNATLSDTPMPTDVDTRPKPTTGQLFYGFLMLGLTAFGGALPLARRMAVDRHRWLTGPEFTELLGLCQFLPGGNVINFSVAVGMKFRGVRGALAALLGLIAAPSVIVVMLGMVYDRFQNDPHIQHLFAGMAAGAAGLLISMAVKISVPMFKNRDWVSGLVAGLCFVAIAVLRVPLLPTMAILTPLSIFLVWRKRQ